MRVKPLAIVAGGKNIGNTAWCGGLVDGGFVRRREVDGEHLLAMRGLERLR